MKLSRVVFTFIVCAAVAVAAFWASRRASRAPGQGFASAVSTNRQQVFTVQGRVISLDVDSGIVKIAHEAIPNYMPAMTMPFLARDSNSLRGLHPGDSVTFVLTVNERDSWISGISRKSLASSNSLAEPQTPAVDHLKPGQKVPNFDFVDQDGRTRTLFEFAGKYVVLTFIYTRCPLPDFCPLLSTKFSELQARLGKEFPGEFHLISVSIDPRYDTPVVLKGYSQAHNANPATWTFATGTLEQVHTVARLFGLTFSQKNGGFIEHDLRTVLIGADGRVVHTWKSNFWTPYEVRNRIEEQQHAKETL